ncbi:MAG: GNAT family N-acetyltransferase [Bacteroidetes bacterium]|nr:GNAT family N-acetyltransferase [Bacteroidota bacterium]
MTTNFNIRTAGQGDIGFLIQAFIHAEKSGATLLSYCYLFDIKETEFEIILSELLTMDIPGQEFHLSSYLIAETEGQSVATLCAWIEEEPGLSSGAIKAHLLAEAIGHDKFTDSRSRLVKLNKTNPSREPGCLQIETVFVAPEFRGKGLTAQLVYEAVMQHGGLNFGKRKIQVILAKKNKPAQKAYKRMGFSVTDEKYSDDPEISAVVPGGSRILMECSAEHLIRMTNERLRNIGPGK